MSVQLSLKRMLPMRTPGSSYVSKPVNVPVDVQFAEPVDKSQDNPLLAPLISVFPFFFWRLNSHRHSTLRTNGILRNLLKTNKSVTADPSLISGGRPPKKTCETLTGI